MKKQIMIATTALMLTAGAVTGVETGQAQAASKKIAINKKNFPDQVFRELVRANYDKNKDKKLSKKEIKKAKQFGTYFCKNSVKIKPSKYAKYERKYVSDIKNFKGIEKLTNLRKFEASGTSVKTVNFKKNKKLNTLVMSDGKLQKLNLNNNKELKYVLLEYNQLTTLKMNKCKKLIEVRLTGHMVKDLKINRNKSTKVYGEEYYAPFERTKVKEAFTQNDGGQLDVNGNYCIYQWNEDYSSCVKKTWNGTAMISTNITLGTEVTTKTKVIQKITAQWQDAQGNFYFVADKDGDMVETTVNYLYKIDAKGGIEKEVKINDQMFFSTEYADRCTLTFMNQNDGIVALKMKTKGTKHGILFFDTNKMQVTKQVECSFEPLAIEGDVVAGNDLESIDDVDNGYVVVSKITQGEMKMLTDEKTELEVVTLSSSHKIMIPERYEYNAFSISIKDNYLYMINSTGFYKAKLTGDSFKQLYGVGKLSGMQNKDMTYVMTMKSEKEIYLMSATPDEDEKTYSLQVGKIQ